MQRTHHWRATTRFRNQEQITGASVTHTDCLPFVWQSREEVSGRGAALAPRRQAVNLGVVLQ